MDLIVYTDGASRGNPGPASYGFVLSDKKGKVFYQDGGFIGIATNNVAEYTGLIKALEYMLSSYQETDRISVDCRMDSQLLAMQLNGKYKLKSGNLIGLFNRIKFLEKRFNKLTYSHIPREKNKLADKMANNALDNLR